MTKSLYEEIYIIGYGAVAKNILKLCASKASDYGYKVTFIEYEKDKFSFIKRECEELGLGYITFDTKADLTAFFMGITTKSLVVSAINNYIFTSDFIAKENIKIINYHFSLLPDYAGRNGLVWTLYNREKIAGITWHFVEPLVDGGDIVIQKPISIEGYETAYEVARVYMDLAFEGFCEIFDNLVTGNVVTTKNERALHREYRLKDVPQNGEFSLDDKPEDIYHLLCSTDIGAIREKHRIHTVIDGKEVDVVRYKKLDTWDREAKENVLVLPMESGKWLQIKYKEST